MLKWDEYYYENTGKQSGKKSYATRIFRNHLEYFILFKNGVSVIAVKEKLKLK